MSKKSRLRNILMPDELYEECVSIAGPRNFSAWARDALIAAAGQARQLPGKILGGPCGSSSGCRNEGAFTYNKVARILVCDSCASSFPAPEYLEDRRSLFVSGGATGRREVLLQAVVRAAAALAEHDRQNPVEKPSTWKPAPDA